MGFFIKGILTVVSAQEGSEGEKDKLSRYQLWLLGQTAATMRACVMRGKVQLPYAMSEWCGVRQLLRGASASSTLF
jgi:hypothetical protein